MRKLLVKLGDRTYPIYIAHGGLTGISPYMETATRARRLLLVSNSLVFSIYGANTVKALEASGYQVRVCLMPDGEGFKNMEEALKIIDQAIDWKFERSGAVVALGGGVVGDLAGFVAAVIHRGVDFIQLPTSLLAQVDSSVGGKVAVNHTRGKNLIGAFHQPRLVFIDHLTLKTLEPREYLSGLGEVAKYGLACDAGFFNYLEEHAGAILSQKPECLEEIIFNCCRIKGGIVEQDEQETGLRMVLNLGHTFGHALEVLGNYHTFRHGEAVVMGTMAAAFLALEYGCLDKHQLQRIQAFYERLGLNTRMPAYDPGSVYSAMLNDKKASHNRLRFVLPRGIGNYLILEDPSREQVCRAINRAQA